MVFVWFSFGADSHALRASVMSAVHFASIPGDSYVVFEEREAPVCQPHRAALSRLGVSFVARDPFRNLSGSQDSIRSIFAFLASVGEEIWKVDSDTLLLGREWRVPFACGCDLVGPQNPSHPRAIMGMSYLVRHRLLRTVLVRQWADYSSRQWPEDFVLGSEAHAAGITSLHMIPFASGQWCGWSYGPGATPEAYAGYQVVTFGNRHCLTGTDYERRQKVGDAMHKLLADRLQGPCIDLA